MNAGRAPATRKRTLQEAQARIRRVVGEVQRFLRASGVPVPRRVRLLMDCRLIRKNRDQEGDPRAYFHVSHVSKWTICGAHEAGWLNDNHLYGLVLHEFGHPLAWRFYGRSKQEDADRAIFDTTGVPILYKSGIVLQWITDADVRLVRGGRVRARAGDINYGLRPKIRPRST